MKLAELIARVMLAAGRSTRAIGGALGVDAATVHRDLSGVASATPGQARLERILVLVDTQADPAVVAATLEAATPEEANAAGQIVDVELELAIAYRDHVALRRAFLRAAGEELEP